MIIGRRSFIAGIIAAGVAPAIVRAGSLMKIKPVIVPPVQTTAWEVSNWGVFPARIVTAFPQRVWWLDGNGKFVVFPEPMSGALVLDRKQLWLDS